MSVTIKIEELTNISLLEQQGSGWSKLYSATFNSKSVVLKTQVKELDRHYVEKETLDLEIDGVVNLIGSGITDDSYPFLVIERLTPLPEHMNRDVLQNVITDTLYSLRQLYLHECSWIARLSHILMDGGGKTCIVDFNDNVYKHIPFFGKEEAIVIQGDCNNNGIYLGKDKYPYSGWLAVMKFLCQKNGVNWEDLIYEAIDTLICKEYQSLQNVHQPIYISRYKNVSRKQTETNDPNFGKLVPANRVCVDRAQMMFDAIDFDITNKTYLDIGCDVGWFCFFFAKKGMKVTGIDIEDKIPFVDMLSEMQTINAEFVAKDITIEYIKQMQDFDIISALSILHWFILPPPEGSSQKSTPFGKEYFISLLQEISKKVREVFFFEFPPYRFSTLGISNTEGLCRFVKDIGKFKEVKSVGITDANRPMLYCKK